MSVIKWLSVGDEPAVITKSFADPDRAQKAWEEAVDRFIRHEIPVVWLQRDNVLTAVAEKKGGQFLCYRHDDNALLLSAARARDYLRRV